ncbi:MAG: DUF1629 domain-containing protein [Litoreibacter sp.]
MAWGMHQPSGLGDFFPDGDYVGWNEALKSFYDDEMSDEEKASMGMSERILYSKFSAKHRLDQGPLKPVECPEEFLTVKGYKTLGDFIKLNDRLLAVSEAFKEIVEDIEPGIHQFWPLKISMPRNKVYPGNYFGLRIGPFLDTFNPDHSDDGCYNISGYENYRGIAPIKKAITGLAVSREVIGDAHLWREQKVTQPDYFFSDAVQARLVGQGLRLPKHFQMKEV